MKITKFSKMNQTIDFYKLYRKARDSYIEFHAHAGFKFRFVAIIGAASFPAYYIIWKYIFPQPYESITLRTIGCILCILLAISKYWPRFLKSYSILYTYICLCYALPFFFMTMLFMNNGNIIWQLSTMAAILFITLLYDTVNMILVTIIGTLAAILFFYSQTGNLLVPSTVWGMFPIFGFILIGIAAFNYSDDIIAKEKLKAASTLASHIAHEMRTPLLGVQLEAEKIQKYVPIFLESYHWAKKKGWEGKRISKVQLGGVAGSMQRIKDHSTSANLMIDILLMNVRQRNFPSVEFSELSARETMEKAIERYYFRANEKDIIQFEQDNDFNYLGSEILLIHVAFNIIRNALRSIHAKGEGNLKIHFVKGRTQNKIIFSDTGQGMEPEMVKYIFIPFFSGANDTGTNDNTGTGIGLSFVKFVIEAFGGTIDCTSELGVGTQFVISLPFM